MLEKKGTLDNQKKLWDEISAVKGDLSGWLDGNLGMLESSSSEFGDAASMQQQLEKFKVTSQLYHHHRDSYSTFISLFYGGGGNQSRKSRECSLGRAFITVRP